VSGTSASPRRAASPEYRGKRALDLALTLLAAPLWVPLLAVVALAVRVRLGSPVLFRQARVGRGDRIFELLKFRTMTSARGADGELLPDAERLPPFGRRLRSTSLDELPSLLNVLAGELSLVGPRPLLPRYLPRYSAYHRRRHDVRPGLTGLAQVRGRNALAWPARFDADVEYVERCSLALDVRILLRTLGLVVRRQGVSAPNEATMSEFTGY
jgi:lipopolysaccharide/colanic/teichoic acid biosynthesis glycosyltransferase